jgi:hypothetical protein
MDDAEFMEELQRHLEFISGHFPFTPAIDTPAVDMPAFDTPAVDTSAIPLGHQTEQASTFITEPVAASPSDSLTTIPTNRTVQKYYLDQARKSLQQTSSTTDDK